MTLLLKLAKTINPTHRGRKTSANPDPLYERHSFVTLTFFLAKKQFYPPPQKNNNKKHSPKRRTSVRRLEAKKITEKFRGFSHSQLSGFPIRFPSAQGLSNRLSRCSGLSNHNWLSRA